MTNITTISISTIEEGNYYTYNVNYADNHKISNVVDILHSILNEIENKTVDKVDKGLKPLLFCGKIKRRKRAKEIYDSLTFKDFT